MRHFVALSGPRVATNTHFMRLLISAVPSIVIALLHPLSCLASLPRTRATAAPVALVPAAPGEEDYQLGLLFAEGYDVRQDYRLAAFYYRRAAALGQVAAQYELGRLCEGGLGTDRSMATATAWYRRAADKGMALAQTRLAALYVEGSSVGRDYAQALHWLQLAAAQNNPEALNDLANMYKEGHGVTADPVTAIQLFRRAAEAGLALAQLNLGLMYANGEGIVTDSIRAWAWLNLAAREFEGAAQIRDRVAEEMSASELESARVFSSQNDRTAPPPARR
jgi:hypothetical protein